MFLAPLRKLFTVRRKRNRPQHTKTTPLRFEQMEGRAMAAAFLASPPSPKPADQFMVAAAAASNTMGNNMASYLRARLGQRIAGGECAHVATASLRFAGADFSHTQFGTNSNDYDWGALVTRLTNGSQLAGKQFQVGDIIQYQDATFSAGGAAKFAHHTQVVSAVDANGKITKVFEQNINGDRTLRESAIVDLSKLTGGSVTIYRAEKMPTTAGTLEFTLVNNTAAAVNVTTKIGTFQGNSTLTAANTAGSYNTRTVTFSGNVTPQLVVNGKSINITNGAAYEIYTLNGQAAIRTTT